MLLSYMSLFFHNMEHVNEQGEKKERLDIFRRGCLKQSLELLVIWRIYLQMFPFLAWNEWGLCLNYSYTGYREQVRGLQATHLTLLIIITVKKYAYYDFRWHVIISALTTITKFAVPTNCNYLPKVLISNYLFAKLDIVILEREI